MAAEPAPQRDNGRVAAPALNVAKLDAALGALEAALTEPAPHEDIIAALAEPVRAFGAAVREGRNG